MTATKPQTYREEIRDRVIAAAEEGHGAIEIHHGDGDFWTLIHRKGEWTGVSCGRITRSVDRIAIILIRSAEPDDDGDSPLDLICSINWKVAGEQVYSGPIGIYESDCDTEEFSDTFAIIDAEEVEAVRGMLEDQIEVLWVQE